MRQGSREALRLITEEARRGKENPRPSEELAERKQRAIERSRTRSPYSVEVDENLVTVSQNYVGVMSEQLETLTIILPHVTGVSGMKTDSGYLKLPYFSVHMAGGHKFDVYSAEPFDHFMDSGHRDAEKNKLEREWHCQRLAAQRHEVLVAINNFLRRRHPAVPNTQLSLGF